MSDQPHSSLRERQNEATRREIAIAALKLFERQGFRGTTIDDIAREVGVSSRTVFRHFATKNDLILGWLPDIEAELAALDLTSTEPRPLLTELEDAVAGAIGRYAADLGAAEAASMGRSQRLYISDPDLQQALIAWEGRMIVVSRQKLADQLGDAGDDMIVVIILRLVAAALLAAIDAWVRDPESNLSEHYEVARRRRDALVAPE